MKTLSLFVVIAAAVTAVWAANVETNAARFARGLPPLPPRNLFTPVAAAKRGHPSGHPVCSYGTAECCASVVKAHNPTASVIIKLLGIHVPEDVTVGLTCEPLVGRRCPDDRYAVCCGDTSHGEIIALSCVHLELDD